MPTSTASDYMRSALFGLATVAIWAGWIVAARFGLQSSLTPWDITAIRFGVAGVIVLPYLLKKDRLLIASVGWALWRLHSGAARPWC